MNRPEILPRARCAASAAACGLALDNMAHRGVQHGR
jgi:hypothetical protein